MTTVLIAVACVVGLLAWAAAIFHPWLTETAWPQLHALIAGPGRHRASVHPVTAVRRPAGAGRRAR